VAVHEDLEVPCADPRDHGAETVNEDLVEAERLVLAAHSLAPFALLPALGGDGDEIPEESDNVFLVLLCRFERFHTSRHSFLQRAAGHRVL